MINMYLKVNATIVMSNAQIVHKLQAIVDIVLEIEKINQLVVAQMVLMILMRHTVQIVTMNV